VDSNGSVPICPGRQRRTSHRSPGACRLISGGRQIR
jgi:hypothetical protein